MATRKRRPGRPKTPALTKRQIAMIRRRYATGRYSKQSLADEYGVSDSTISYYLNKA